jgi:imidazolonepropionase-like amidohydrolase
VIFAQDLVITNARILDGTGRVIKRGSVVISSRKIALVASGTASVPRGARVIDVQARTIPPDLPTHTGTSFAATAHSG